MQRHSPLFNLKATLRVGGSGRAKCIGKQGFEMLEGPTRCVELSVECKP